MLYVLKKLQQIVESETIWIQPSCTLLHVPVSVASENNLPEQLKTNLAFASEKLTKLTILRNALLYGIEEYKPIFVENSASIHDFNSSVLDRLLVYMRQFQK